MRKTTHNTYTLKENQSTNFYQTEGAKCEDSNFEGLYDYYQFCAVRKEGKKKNYQWRSEFRTTPSFKHSSLYISDTLPPTIRSSGPVCSLPHKPWACWGLSCRRTPRRMSSTLLEVTRATHEDVERLERLIVKDLQTEPPTAKDRLHQSHRVRNMIELIMQSTHKLVILWIHTLYYFKLFNPLLPYTSISLMSMQLQFIIMLFLGWDLRR